MSSRRRNQTRLAITRNDVQRTQMGVMDDLRQASLTIAYCHSEQQLASP